MPDRFSSGDNRRSQLPAIVMTVTLALVAGVAGTMFVLPYATSLIVQKAADATAPTVDLPRAHAAPSLSAGSVAPSARATAVFAATKASAVGAAGKAYVPGEAIGMGFVVTSDGWIATVEDATKKRSLTDAAVSVAGRTFKVQRAVRDSFSGVTFLKSDAENLPVAAMGTTVAISAGDNVFVVDQAGGLRRFDVLANETRPAKTVDDAVRSSEKAQRMLRISGTGLMPGTMVLDGKGVIIGLVGGDDGFGTTVIPVEAFSDVIGSVLGGQVVSRPLLGVSYVDLSLLLGREGQQPSRGALIAGTADGKVPAVLKGGPAASVGLRAGDLVLAIDGEQISPKNALADAVMQYSPGDKVTLTIQRGNGSITQDVIVTLGTVSAK